MSFAREHVALVALVGVALSQEACSRKPRDVGNVTPPTPDGGGATLTASADASADAVAVAPALGWVEAVRAHRWKQAVASIEALPQAERDKPEVRFALARAAVEAGAYKSAEGALADLENALPLLRDRIAELRAEVWAELGPYGKAGDYFAASGRPADSLRAARAYAKGGDAAHARAACDRVVAAPKRRAADEEGARALRMELVKAADGEAATLGDARWLAVHAVDAHHATEAQAVLRRAKQTLPSGDLLTRSHVLASARKTDDALRAADLAATRGASAADVCRARAEALYKARTRYPEAALAYRSCAAAGGPHAAEYLFLSARAFSRADRDGDALPAFGAVSSRFPRTPWAEQAEFHVARAHALKGRWRDATTAFDAYARRHPSGSQKREADRYRALAHLMAGNAKDARRLLEELAGSGEDAVAVGRWTNLAALAAYRDGDKMHAVARWGQVARSRPLTWPALVARARLTQERAALPVAIDPPLSAPAPEPLTVTLPPPVDMLHRVGLDDDAEDALRAREPLVSNQGQGRGTEALCAAYAMLDRAKRRFQLSLGISPTALSYAPGARTRWAWECAYPRPLASLTADKEKELGLPTGLVHAVMRQESAFDAAVVSPARAVGLMQLLPETGATTAKHAGLEHAEDLLTSPPHNVTLGAIYLHEMMDKFDNVVPLAVAAYNAGPDAIARWRAATKDAPLDVFVELIPFTETRGYVARVMGNLAHYGLMERGEAGVPSLALGAN